MNDTTSIPGTTCASGPMYQYRYFAKPRPISTVCWPGIGDFVVLSIDPVASVGHLDKIAKRAARKVPVRKFVALTTSGYGLPLKSKPYTAFLLAFVRQGLPTLDNPPWDTSDMCYPIFPNTYHPKARGAVRPSHPFPLQNCYFETTRPFLTYYNLRCRVTTTPRDYTPVLPMPSSELSRLERLMDQEVHYRAEIRCQLAQGDLSAVASIPLPPSPSSAYGTLPPSFPPTSSSLDGQSSDESSGDEESEDCVVSPTSEADDVSIIRSEDSSGSFADEGSEMDELPTDYDAVDAQLDLMLRFEDFMNDTGDLRDPVVNVWYDLDMVTEVTDPMLFIEARKQLLQIIDEAEIRLGIRTGTSEPSAQSDRGSMNTLPSPAVLSAESLSLPRPREGFKPRPSRWMRLRGVTRKLVSALLQLHRVQELGRLTSRFASSRT